jgi:hypothetical protein
MTQRKRFSSFGWTVFLAITLVLAASCGGGSKPQSISAAQAQAVSQEVLTSVQTALNASLSSGLSSSYREHRSLAKIVQEARSAETSGCVISANGQSCDIPVSYTGPCPAGGTISVSGNLDFTLNNSGDGSDNTTLTITPANCVVSNLTLNGNPDVTVASQIGFENDALEYPITFAEGGGVTYGPKPAGSCALDVTLTVNSATSCTISGTACGQTLSGSC